MSIYLSSRKLKDNYLLRYLVSNWPKTIFLKTWPEEKSLSTNTGCDVIPGTEVIFTHFVYYNFVLRAEAVV